MVWIVALLFALQSPATAAYWSWLDGQRLEFVVPPDTARLVPWPESADSPPLAPRAAIRSAEQLLPRLVPNAEQWTVRDLHLQPAIGSGDVWVYLVDFVKSPPPNVMWDGPLPSLRLVVLMNGTAVVPTVTSDPSAGKIPEVAVPTRYLLVERRPSEDISVLWVIELQAEILVQLDGESVPVDREFSRPLHTREVHVWLLRTDGTGVALVRPPTHIGASMSDSMTDTMQFLFMRVPSTELAGVAVSVDGKMLVRDIPKGTPGTATVPPQ